jgi:hypothetical protein
MHQQRIIVLIKLFATPVVTTPFVVITDTTTTITG